MTGSTYQRLRGHLAYLGLSTAAEHLAAHLDDPKASVTEVLESLLPMCTSDFRPILLLMWLTSLVALGWASIAIASAYPKAIVTGFDLDESSIEIASKNASERGLHDRVTFEVQDIAESSLEGGYDLVVVIEAIHDLSRPVEALASIRKVLAPGGCAIVADEKTSDIFTAPGDELERLYYGFSVLCCLPAGMSEQPSAGTGTVMRADTMRSYATEAGFSDVKVLDIPHDLLRFYRLTP